MSKHYVNETGSDLILDTGVLIGTATEYHIGYKTPAGVEGTFSADLYDTYSTLAALTGTYFLKHTLAYGDLSVPGDWKFQAYVGAIDGTWYGETITMRIHDQLE